VNSAIGPSDLNTPASGLIVSYAQNAQSFHTFIFITELNVMLWLILNRVKDTPMRKTKQL
jgi:hypothetical protein